MDYLRTDKHEESNLSSQDTDLILSSQPDIFKKTKKKGKKNSKTTINEDINQSNWEDTEDKHESNLSSQGKDYEDYNLSSPDTVGVLSSSESDYFQRIRKRKRTKRVKKRPEQEEKIQLINRANAYGILDEDSSFSSERSTVIPFSQNFSSVTQRKQNKWEVHETQSEEENGAKKTKNIDGKHSSESVLLSDCARLVQSEDTDEISEHKKKKKKRKILGDNESDEGIHKVTCNNKDDSQRKRSNKPVLSSECATLVLSEDTDNISQNEKKKKKRKKLGDSQSVEEIQKITSNSEDDSPGILDEDSSFSSERSTVIPFSQNFSSVTQRKQNKWEAHETQSEEENGAKKTKNIDGKHSSESVLLSDCARLVQSEDTDEISEHKKKKKKRKILGDNESDEGIHKVTCNNKDDSQRKRSNKPVLSSECATLVLSEDTDNISQNEKKKKKRKKLGDSQSVEEIQKITSNSEDDSPGILDEDSSFSSERSTVIPFSQNFSSVTQRKQNKWEVHETQSEEENGAKKTKNIDGEQHDKSNLSSQDTVIYEFSELEDISKETEKRKNRHKTQNEEEIDHIYKNAEGKRSNKPVLSSECATLVLSEDTDNISQNEKKKKKRKKLGDSQSVEEIQKITSNSEDDSPGEQHDKSNLSSQDTVIYEFSELEDISKETEKRKNRHKTQNEEEIDHIYKNAEDKHESNLSSQGTVVILSSESDISKRTKRKRHSEITIKEDLSQSNTEDKHEESNLSSQGTVVIISSESDISKRPKKKRKRHSEATINEDLNQSSLEVSEGKDYEDYNLSSPDTVGVLSSSESDYFQRIRKRKRTKRVKKRPEQEEKIQLINRANAYGEQHDKSNLSSQDTVIYEFSELEDISKETEKRKNRHKTQNEEEIDHIYKNAEDKHESNLSSQGTVVILSSESDISKRTKRKRHSEITIKEDLSQSNTEDKHEESNLSSQGTVVIISSESDISKRPKKKRKRHSEATINEDLNQSSLEVSEGKDYEDYNLSSPDTVGVLSSSESDYFQRIRKRKRTKRVKKRPEQEEKIQLINRANAYGILDEDSSFSSERSTVIPFSQNFSSVTQRKQNKWEVHETQSEEENGAKKTKNIDGKHSSESVLLSDCARLVQSEDTDEISEHKKKKKKRKILGDNESDEGIHKVTCNNKDDSQRKRSNKPVLSSECATLVLSEDTDNISQNEKKKKKRKKLGDSQSVEEIQKITSNSEDDSPGILDEDSSFSSERSTVIPFSQNFSSVTQRKQNKWEVHETQSEEENGAKKTKNIDGKHSSESVLLSDCARLVQSEDTDEISEHKKKKKKRKILGDNESDEGIHKVTCNNKDDSQRKRSNKPVLSSECATLVLSEDTDNISQNEKKKKKRKKLGDSQSVEEIQKITSNSEDDSPGILDEDSSFSSERSTVIPFSQNFSSVTQRKQNKWEVHETQSEEENGAKKTKNIDGKHSSESVLLSDCARLVQSEDTDEISEHKKKKKKRKILGDNESDEGIHKVTCNNKDDSQRKRSNKPVLSSECATLFLSEDTDNISQNKKKRKKLDDNP